MKRTGVYLGVLLLTLLLPETMLKGASREDIIRVRQINVLTAEHLDLIDEYVSERLGRIRFAEAPDVVADALNELRHVTQSEAADEEGRQIYSRRFSEAVQKELPEILKRAKELMGTGDPQLEQLGQQMAVSVPVLLVSCDNPIGLDELVALLDHPAASVRYWAVEGLGAAATLAALSNDASTQARVLEGMGKCLERENPAELQERIAQWAAKLPQESGVDALFEKIVAQRIARYQAWDVRQEMADLGIVRSIVAVAMTPEVLAARIRVPKLARLAADLYVAAGTRYVKAMGYELKTGERTEPLSLLSDEGQKASETLLIDGEVQLLSLAARGTEVYTARMAESIASENWSLVQAAVNALAGTEGVLNRAYRIYAAGDEQVTVPDAPEQVVDQARTLATLRRNLLEVEY
jgi:hypothetical protein